MKKITISSKNKLILIGFFGCFGLSLFLTPEKITLNYFIVIFFVSLLFSLFLYGNLFEEPKN